MQRFEAEVDGRGNGISGQQSVGQFEQGVSAAIEASVEGSTEIVEMGEGG